MRFAERLRQLRTEAGLSEAKLADKSGVSFGAIHNYGLGNRLPTFAAVVKIATALGVTCEAFAECDDIVGEEVGQPAPPVQKPAAPPGRPRKPVAEKPAPPAEPTKPARKPRKPKD